MRYRLVAVLSALVICGIALTGCASSESEANAPEPETVTLVATETVIRSQPAPAPAAENPAETVEKAADTPAAPQSAQGIIVPNVVGKDHQLAQDTMQAAGLYNLAEEDATGQGRVLLWDRNWVVVSQSPAAGSVVQDDTTITLRSKKDDE